MNPRVSYCIQRLLLRGERTECYMASLMLPTMFIDARENTHTHTHTRGGETLPLLHIVNILTQRFILTGT